jgi:hypothetical protein
MQTQTGFTWQGYTAGRSVECTRYGKRPEAEAPGKKRPGKRTQPGLGRTKGRR